MLLCCFFFFYYMRLLLRLQLILHENIIDIYKSDYYWDQLISMLIELCPDFNPHKYSRNIHSSLTNIRGISIPHSWVKKMAAFTQFLIKKRNTPIISIPHSWVKKMTAFTQFLIKKENTSIMLLLLFGIGAH